MLSTRHKSIIDIRRTDGLPPIPDQFGGRWMGWGKVPDWANDVVGDINIVDKGEGFTFRINGVPVVMEGPAVVGPNGSIQFNNNGSAGGSAGLIWDDAGQKLLAGSGGVDINGCYQILGVSFACSPNQGVINLTNIGTINGQAPGGAQTPWTSNIDAANFSLSNIKNLSGGGAAFAFAANLLSLTVPYFSIGQAGNPIGLVVGPHVGIFNSNPQYPLDVTGDVNITGVYRVNGVPIGGGGENQTPWLSDINAAGYTLNGLHNINSMDSSASLQVTAQYFVLGVPGVNPVIFAFSGGGRVGINNPNPTYNLDIHGETNADNMYRVNGVPLNQIFLSLSGGTLTGPLYLSGDPSTGLQAATKQYVDSAVSGALSYIGTIDASTGDCVFTTASGLPNGPLPPASSTNGNFVICTVAGTIPSGPATGITMKVGDWLVSDGIDWSLIAVGGQTVTAGSVGVSPNVFGASNVQVALQNAETLTTSLQNQINNKVSSQWINGSSGAIYYNSGNVGIGTATTPNRLTITGPSPQVRIAQNSYGVLMHNDDSDFYFLVTAANDPYGGWVNLYPFRFHLATGAVTMAQGCSISNGLNVSGLLSIAGRLGVGANAVPNQVGDIGISRDAAPGTGAIYFGNTGGAYITFDGSTFGFSHAIYTPSLSTGGVTCSALNCSGDLVANRISSTGNVYYMAGGAVYITWNGSSIAHSHDISAPTASIAGTISAGGAIWANGNALYFASGAVQIVWNGSWIDVSHAMGIHGSVTMYSNLQVSGSSTVHGIGSQGDISVTGDIYCTNGMAAGGAGIMASSFNCPGGYYVNGGAYAMSSVWHNSAFTGNWPRMNFINGSGSNCQMVGSSSVGAAIDIWFDIYGISDERVKKNIRPLEGGMSIINRIRPISAEFNGLGGYKEGEKIVSVMAQELQSVLPDAVHKFQSYLKKDEPAELLSIDHSHILFHTVLAVKQLDARVKILEGKLA